MQLKFLQTILTAQDCENKVAALAWSPNNLKLAVATSDRQIIIFDEKGDRRDKFSTKPVDASRGKKSYVIKGIAFSPDSTKIAVAQSDCIVYVYKIGDGWGEKKVICNKFSQPQPVMCIIWLAVGPIICGLTDGKVRALHTKSNKSQSLFGSESLVVALTANQKGTGFLSGHADGSIVRFFVAEDAQSGQPQGRVLTHSSSPYALAWPQGQIVAAGCDKRVVIYDGQAKLIRTFDYSKDDDEHDFTIASCSPSGQTVAIGSFDRLRIYGWSPRDATWNEGPVKEMPYFYTVTALAWKRDGSRVACGGLCGSVELFESVLRRTIWKDKFELTYVGPSQVLVKPLGLEGGRGVILRSQLGREIDDVRIMGKDRYLVARTEDTLLLGDLHRNLLSEVPWNSSGRHEKFYFDNPTVCLVFNAGELSLIEYGDNSILSSVRTEFANPHLISVRLNERNQNFENKKLAYLLDLKTVCIIDLISGITTNQISHDSKIDWLELSETAHKLLFRDKKQRLVLVDTGNNEKTTILSGVSFVQWIPGSDVAVAQSRTNLAVWYNIDLPDRVTLTPIQGEIIDVVRENGKTEALSQDGNINLSYELDEGLVEFGTAIHDNDYGRAILFLETLGDKPEAEGMWHNLANISISLNNLKVAERCFAALGDVAKSYYLKEILKIADEYEKTHHLDGMQCPEVWARMAILNNDLKTAENIYLEHGDIESALLMYKKYHMWDEALTLAEQRAYPNYEDLKESYMSFLLRTGQEERAGQILEDKGDVKKALDLYLKANRPSRASKIVQQNQNLLNNDDLIMKITKQLLKNQLFEQAAELYHAVGRDEMALQFYRKGKVYPKAIDLSRNVAPDQIIALEEEWGDNLVATKQLDAAINHYIEAGKTLKALDAAVEARQWKKAVQIISVFEDPAVVLKYYEKLTKHFVEVKEYSTAETLFIKADMFHEAVDMYNESKQWDKAHALASKYLDSSEVSDMYRKQAKQLETENKFRDAEKLYLSVGEPDLAIAMYKRQDQYDNMIRMVERFHPDLVQTTHLHLGQRLEEQNKYRAAEGHYLAADEWRAAVNMYRANNMWEEAHRVAKQKGGPAAANQIAFIWARTLPLESAINLLNKFGVLETCIDYACESLQFEFAFKLSKNVKHKLADVHYKYAMQLEDDGKYAEAEAEFISAEKPKEAVLMYVHNRDWDNALKIAENHEPSTVPEVLLAQANECFTQKDFSQYEALLLRAQKPEMIIQQYKDAGMWVDALRICREYMPNILPSLQSEYQRSVNNVGEPSDVNALFSQASDWLENGEYKQAIGCLLRVTPKIADQATVNQALLQAADLTNRFLDGPIGIDVVKILGPRLIDIGQNTIAAQLFLSVDLIKEAIDSFIAAEEWSKAKKVAKELEPVYESYVETKYKDRLRKEGNVEQLADIDIIGALDLLAEQGQWARCIEKAKSQGNEHVLHKYVALYATQLLRDGYTLEALTLYVTNGAPALQPNFNIYVRICSDMFSMPDVSEPNSYNMWSQLRQVLFTLNEALQLVSVVTTETKQQFRTLLLITHYLSMRCACKQVATLGSMVAKISAAILRYTDIIPADKGFYEAGMDMRGLGRDSEAFVFLNHYLDICDAIEDQDEGGAQLVDHSDLTCTDFPSNIPLPAEIYLKNEPEKHDEAKEWVLAISMDQKINQTLPTDERSLYESSLRIDDSPCIVTGYPVSNARQPVTFQRSNMKANRDAWAKLILATKMAPHSDVTNVVTFIEQWCGSSSYVM